MEKELIQFVESHKGEKIMFELIEDDIKYGIEIMKKFPLEFIFLRLAEKTSIFWILV